MATKPAIIITGASGGIGAELARTFSGDGQLVLIARSGAALEARVTSLQKFVVNQPLILPIDLSRHDSGDAVEEFLAVNSLHAEILVNNAGYGLHGAASTLPCEAQLGIIDVNIRALTDLTLRALPGMIARRRGGILNVASIAAYVPGPYMAMYYASKAFVLSFSEALHQEVDHLGVQVSALCPGPTISDFGRRAGFANHEIFDRVSVMSAAEVADIGYRRFRAGHRVIVTGAQNKLAAGIGRLLPRTLSAKLVSNIQK